MKRGIIIFFISFFIIHVHAQNAAIDSLNRLIVQAQTDTARINLTIEKIVKLSEVNLDSSIILANLMIGQSKKINFQPGEARALIQAAANFSRKGDYTAARQSLEKAEALVTSLKDSSLFARLYAINGMMYGMQSKYDTSIRYYEKSIGIDERLGNKKVLGSSYGNLAIGYEMQSNFPVALLYQQKSLELAEKLNDISAQAYTLMNMGNTYQSIGDTARSEKFILKGISLAKSMGIKNVELYGYSNLATLYSLLNEWDKSYSFAMNSATLAKTMGDYAMQATSISKAALALAHDKKYKDAEVLNKKAMAIADTSGQPLNVFQVYSGMGEILKLQEEYKNAIPFYEKGFNVLKNADQYDEAVAQAYSDLSTCYEKTGNYPKALATYKTSSKILDSVRSKNNIGKATELSMNYEFEKKQAVADAVQGKKNAETKLQQTLLMVGLGVTLIVAAGAWVAFRNKQKANFLLEKQKKEIQRTLTELESTQARLIQSEKMASLGELTAGIAHEIQNPLNFVNNFSEINTELINEMEEEMNKGHTNEAKIIAGNIKKNLEKITHHGKRADAIVKGMLQHSRTSSGQKEPTDINALADEYFRLSYYGLRAKDKTFNATLQTNFDKSIGKINIIPQDIGRVLLNLYTNAFYAVLEKKKLQPAGSSEQSVYEPTVSVVTKKDGDNIYIKVKDNGNGIPQKVADKIFQPFFTTKPAGQGTGLGLSLSYDIIKAHGGEIESVSKKDDGAEFIIQLPAAG